MLTRATREQGKTGPKNALKFAIDKRVKIMIYYSPSRGLIYKLA